MQYVILHVRKILPDCTHVHPQFLQMPGKRCLLAKGYHYAMIHTLHFCLQS